MSILFSYCYDEHIFYDEQGEESEYEYTNRLIDEIEEDLIYNVFNYDHEDSLKDLKTRVFIKVSENKKKNKNGTYNADIFVYEEFGEKIKRVNFDFSDLLKFQVEYTKDDLEKLTLYIDLDYVITFPELNHTQNNHIIQNLYHKIKGT